MILYCKTNIENLSVESVHTWFHKEAIPKLVKERKKELEDIGQSSDHVDTKTVLSDHNLTSVSICTVLNWMTSFGFKYSPKQKGYYVDGHEREDVVKYREGFVKRFVEKYLPRMTHFSGDHMEVEHPPILNGDEKEIVLITHDESIFKVNDDQKYVRLENDEQMLKPKGEGRGIMISDFMCHCHGRLIDQDDDAQDILKYGQNYDGYWDGMNVAEAAKHAHAISRKLHPGKISLFIFDNSANHLKRADDARNAKRLNLKDGGKNVPKIRDGFFFNEQGDRITHPMQTEDGKQKGLRSILSERGLWRDGMKKPEALEVLLKQPDFEPSQLKAYLVEVINSLEDAWVDMYVKYHPEMNFIEMYWGYVKRLVRKRCEYDFQSLCTTVPKCLDEVPIEFIRRAARKSFRYIDAYFKGLSSKQVEFCVKKYSSHRSLPPSYLDDLEM